MKEAIEYLRDQKLCEEEECERERGVVRERQKIIDDLETSILERNARIKAFDDAIALLEKSAS